MGKSLLKKLKQNPLVKAATQVATQSVVGQIAARNPAAASAYQSVKRQKKRNEVRRVSVPGNVANIAIQDSSTQIKPNKQGYNLVTSWQGFTSAYNYGVCSFLVAPWMPNNQQFHNGINIGINKSLLQDSLTHTHYRIKKCRVFLNTSTPSTTNATVSISACKDPTLDIPSWDYFTTMEKSVQFSAWAPDAKERCLDITDVVNKDWLKIDPSVDFLSSAADKNLSCAGQFHLAILTSDTNFVAQFMLAIEVEFRGRNPFDSTPKVALSFTNPAASSTNVTSYYKTLDSLPIQLKYDNTNTKPQIPLKSGYQVFQLNVVACQTAGVTLAYATTIYDSGGNDVSASRTIVQMAAKAAAGTGAQYINNTGGTGGTSTTLAADQISIFLLIYGQPGDTLDFYATDSDTLTANRFISSMTLCGISRRKALEIIQGFTPSQATLPW